MDQCVSKFASFKGFKRLACGIAALMTSEAHAACSAANQYSYSFSTAAAANLSYASTYSYTATSTALGNQNFSVQFTAPTGHNPVISAGTLPNISTAINGGSGNALVIGGIFAARTASISAAANVLVTTLNFPTAVRDVSFTLHDIDFVVNQYRDWISIVGISAAGTYVPAITTPFSMANNTGPYTNASSSAKLGAQAAPLAVGAAEALGIGASGNNSTTGNITATFAQPVTSVQIRYGNFPLQTGETVTGQQAFGLSAVSWCPMPNVTVLKSSTPMITDLTDPTRFNLTDSYVYYTLTVANTNSSPVDANSIILNDPLPALMTFFNGDMDDAGPLTANYEFIPGTSGLTLSPANITYYTAANVVIAAPTAGDNLAVRRISWAPQGVMASNSTFSIRFRAKIK
jgi:uncharacterized repeat protein (TIGR01451 family)